MIASKSIYKGSVMHERLSPSSHKFNYPITFFHFDISKLANLHKEFIFFNYNKFNLISIWDKDYLRGGTTPITDQLSEFLPKQTPGEQTILITSPKYLGYNFNPVNFYIRIKNQSEIKTVLVEVNNTFGDRHLYLLGENKSSDPTRFLSKSNKVFHVSPYNPIEGNYEFDINIKKKSIFLGIDYFKEDKCIMKTYLKGVPINFNKTNFAKYCLLHPLDTAINSMPRILYQAGLLYFKKNIIKYNRPDPKSEYTVIKNNKKDKI